MNDHQHNYCIIQFSPHPERFEFVNVGVLVFDERRGKISKKFSEDFNRVRKIFGEASPSFLRRALYDYCERVVYELDHQRASKTAFDINSKSAGLFKITPILPVFGSNIEDLSSALFSELVEPRIKSPRLERVSTRLSRAFKDAGVLQLLEKRPKPVLLEKWGVNIRADYGFQNGVFNLIDAARFDASERGLAEAGKRILEGRALAETLDHRLIVVGEFIEKSADFVDNLKDEFRQAEASLYSMDEIGQLSNHIRHSAH